MLNCIYKKGPVRINHIWFCERNTKEIEMSKSDICIFHDLKEKNNDGVVSLFLTQVTRLELEYEKLYEDISKTFKYDIRRANKEGIKYVTFSSDIIKREKGILKQFESTYNAMFRDKNIKEKLNRKLLLEYIKKGMILFTIAYIQTEAIVFHVYIIDQEHARLLYSTSSFRKDREMAALIGRANKALHWHDIKYFKENGYKEYDWGGISDFDNPNGIDSFKMSFPGEKRNYYRCFVPNSLMGKIIIRLMMAKKYGK